MFQKVFSLLEPCSSQLSSCFCVVFLGCYVCKKKLPHFFLHAQVKSQQEKVFVEMNAEQRAEHSGGCFGYRTFRHSELTVFPRQLRYRDLKSCSGEVSLAISELRSSSHFPSPRVCLVSVQSNYRWKSSFTDHPSFQVGYLPGKLLRPWHLPSCLFSSSDCL